MTPENAHAQCADPDAGRRTQGGTQAGLPPFRVRTATQEVAAFACATAGAPKLGRVPLTFPACWLALPSVRALITHSIGGGFLPIHEAQNFSYERELEVDREYILGVEACRTQAPPRLTLRMTIASPEGEICARLETVLRIVPINLEPRL
jgi:hypothetical protein